MCFIYRTNTCTPTTQQKNLHQFHYTSEILLPSPGSITHQIVQGMSKYDDSITSVVHKVVQIWPGQTVTCLHTNSPGHIWTTLYISSIKSHHGDISNNSVCQPLAMQRSSRSYKPIWNAVAAFAAAYKHLNSVLIHNYSVPALCDVVVSAGGILTFF